jgi:hypothetical protein
LASKDDVIKKVETDARLIEIFDELKTLYPNVDGKTQKMIKSGVEGLSIENERDSELRIFCVLVNTDTGKYRVTQGDAVFVDDIKKEATFAEAIHAMVAAGKKAGEKITAKDLETIVRGSK